MDETLKANRRSPVADTEEPIIAFIDEQQNFNLVIRQQQ